MYFSALELRLGGVLEVVASFNKAAIKLILP